jgi:hypothetical protein
LEGFFVQYKSEITRFVEISAALTGLLLYRKYQYSSVKYFIYFLIYLSIGDFINTYVYYIKDGVFSFLKGTVLTLNYWWSTLFWNIGAIMFFSFYYSKILKTKKFKKIIKYLGNLFLAFSIMIILFNWDKFFKQNFPSISIFGTIIIMLCSVFYFIETLLSDKILSFYKSLNFYISAAIFIWWLITTPLVFYDIYNAQRDWNFIFLRWQIYLFANIVMYSTFTFALIFCKPDEDNGLIKNE